MKRVLFTSIVTTLAVALSGASARADILIDDFGLPNPGTSYAIGGGPNPTVVNTALGGGLNRTITLTVTTPNPVTSNRLVGDIGEGSFSANFASNASGTVQIAYNYSSAVNFIPNVPAGGAIGDLSFTGNGDSGFASSIPLTLTVATATGNLTYNGTLPLSQTPSTTTVPLSGLTGTGDLAQVTGVTINMTAGAAADLVFDSLGVTTPAAPPPPAVPAPPALVLALAAVPALGLLRARRKAA